MMILFPQSIGSVDELLRIVQQLKSENQARSFLKNLIRNLTSFCVQLLLRDKNELERSLIHVNERYIHSYISNKRGCHGDGCQG